MKFVDGQLMSCMYCREDIMLMARYTAKEEAWHLLHGIEYPEYNFRHPCCGRASSWVFNIPVRAQELSL